MHLELQALLDEFFFQKSQDIFLHVLFSCKFRIEGK